MKTVIPVLFILISSICFGDEQKVDYVLVNKSDKKLYLLSKGSILKSYDIIFGANPVGHKKQEGDQRTPEGKYILDYKKSDSSYYRAIHISYPNDKDSAEAKKTGVNPGGLIMIHGQKNGFGWLSRLMQNFNWTDGCIAVTNEEMDEIWQLVDVGTPIEINP